VLLRHGLDAPLWGSSNPEPQRHLQKARRDAMA